jgi:glyoxylase-like metal-dependent hydrolase (beta-lactamase superfamily II)
METLSSSAVTKNRLDVLAVGNLVRSGTEITVANSTSTLIRAGNINIVVDTSTKAMEASIRASFRQIGVHPKEVSIVVLTHMHCDHCGNNDLFKKARFFVRGEECPEGGDFIPVTGDTEIAPGVRLVHTPGHTEGSMSVFVESERRYAVAGDAIPLEDNYRRMVPPGINYNAKVATESIKSIADYAQVIIPGHGFPFMRDMR